MLRYILWFKIPAVVGDNLSLWKAVKVAKDLNVNELPTTMRENRNEIDENELPDRVASFFHNKVKNLSESATIRNDVYNGQKKVSPDNKMFIS